MPLQYRLFTPEFQWQSRGTRRIAQGGGAQVDADCSGTVSGDEFDVFLKDPMSGVRFRTHSPPLPVRYAVDPCVATIIQG